MFDGLIKTTPKEYLLVQHYSKAIYSVSDQKAMAVFQFSPDERKAFYTYNGVYPVSVSNESNEFLMPIWIPTITEKHSEAFAFLKFDDKFRKVEEVIHYPELYDTPYWSDHPYPYLANIQYIPSKKSYFVSFPLSPDIFIYDEKFNLIGTQKVQSKFIDNIKPFLPQKPARGVDLDWDRARIHFGNMSFYLGAFFDPAQQVYIRLVRKAMDGESVNVDYQYYFIVCNLDLEIIDEIRIPDGYDPMEIFTCSKGIFLLNDQKVIDEFELPFDRILVE